MNKSISILTSLYKSEDFIVEFITEVEKSLTNCNFSNFEFIIVNDGSPDSSVEKIEQNFKGKNLNIKIINLSRNFGHHKALITGMKHCTKDLIFLIDCDLEISPKCLVEFSELMLSDNSIDCIYGVSKKKNKLSIKNFINEIFSKMFAKLFILLSKYNYNKKQVHARLMKKKYVDELINCEHSNPFLIELYEFVGFNQKFLNVDYNKRKGSSYSLKKKIELFFYFFLSNSEKILKMYFMLSLFSVFISFGLMINFLYNYFFREISSGYTSTVLLIVIFGSLILLGTSMCCLFIQQVFKDIKKLPNTIVSSIINI